MTSRSNSDLAPALSWKDWIVEGGHRVLQPLGLSDETLRDVLRHRIRYPQWSRIVARTVNRKEFQPKPDGPRIKMILMNGNMPLTNFEIPLALALQARGANVEIILCDGGQRELCAELTVDALKRRPKEQICRQCIGNALRLLHKTPELRYRLLRDLVSEQRNEQLRSLAWSIPADDLAEYEGDGVRLGRAALQTALRHWRRGTFEGTAEEEAVNRSMLHSAMLTLEAVKTLHEEAEIDVALFSHGLYASWGPALDFFKRQGVHVVTYGEQARKNTWVFAANDCCRLADISKPFKQRWANRQLTPQQRQRALDYLNSRADFRDDTLKLTYGSEVAQTEVLRRLGLRADRPVLTLFGNLLWDASSVGRDLIFDNILDWVFQTIRFIGDRPELQLLIKPHPSEALRGTRQELAVEIQRAFPTLPSNVVVTSPRVDMNAPSIMQVTDVGLVHTSTVGMEMAIRGIPVIVSSWTHYRGYGFTFDPAGTAEYFDLLENPDALKQRMTEEQQELALKYFFVRCFCAWLEIPIVKFDDRRAAYGWHFESLDALLPGRNTQLDFVCEGIRNRRGDFVNDATEMKNAYALAPSSSVTSSR